MARENKNTVLGFAVLALFVCFVLWMFFTSLFQDSFGSRSEKSKQATQTTNTTRDPLVTVVPEAIRGGIPHVLPTDPARGALDGPVTIIEFGDFECEACARMSAVMAQLVEEYPNDVRHVWKDFPIPALHASSKEAAIAARCAQNQGAFWEFHDALFQQQSQFASDPWVDIAEELALDTDVFSRCIQGSDTEDLVLEGYFIARALSVDSAPSYYINDTRITGERSVDEMRQLVEQAIDTAKNQ